MGFLIPHFSFKVISCTMTFLTIIFFKRKMIVRNVIVQMKKKTWINIPSISVITSMTFRFCWDLIKWTLRPNFFWLHPYKGYSSTCSGSLKRWQVSDEYMRMATKTFIRFEASEWENPMIGQILRLASVTRKCSLMSMKIKPLHILTMGPGWQ